MKQRADSHKTLLAIRSVCFMLCFIPEHRCALRRRRGATCWLKEKTHGGKIVTCRCSAPRPELSARKHARHKYRR